jgi:iron complex transport system substrate-binding protein
MRIVSLRPSGTELACALGLREHLVGVSHECDFPKGVSELPQLTSSILDHSLTPAQIDAAVADPSQERRPI